MTITGLDRWYGFMKSHDQAALWDLLHPDVVFESPVVHTPQRGRDLLDILAPYAEEGESARVVKMSKVVRGR